MPVVSTNAAASAALSYLNGNADQEGRALSRLASGSRIVSASDDAAGLAIGGQLQASLTGYGQDSVNIRQGTAILQTADGALAQIGNILQRMMALASTAASGQISSTQRGQDLQTEYGQLSAEITNIISTTRFGAQQLLSGSFLSSARYLIGTTSSDSFSLSLSAISLNSLLGVGTTHIQATVTIASGVNAGTYGEYSDSSGTIILSSPGGGAQASSGILRFIDVDGNYVYNSNNAGYNHLTMHPAVGLTGNVTAVMVGSGLSVATQTDATYALAAINSAIGTISQNRARIGAYESRFNFTAQDIDSNRQNLGAALSVILDADVAGEKSKLSSIDVRTRAAVAALAQASQLPRELLRLIL